MNERKKEQDENMVQCPACNGQGEFRGPETRIKWFECAYCYGTGGVIFFFKQKTAYEITR